VSTNNAKNVCPGTILDDNNSAEDWPPRTVAANFSTADSRTGDAFTRGLEKGYFCRSGCPTLPRQNPIGVWTVPH